MKKILAFVISTLFLFSCGTTSGGKNDTALTKKDLVGKSYSLEGYTANPDRPEEGGVPFIKFEDNYAMYLTGDILNNATYEIKDGKIICNNEQFNRTLTFTIVDAKTLKDETNRIWKLK